MTLSALRTSTLEVSRFKSLAYLWPHDEMKIKNISGFNVRLPKIGAVASGEVIDVPTKVADYLITTTNFKKASSDKKKSGGKE